MIPFFGGPNRPRGSPAGRRVALAVGRDQGQGEDEDCAHGYGYSHGIRPQALVKG